jgi:hypothetical protein
MRASVAEAGNRQRTVTVTNKARRVATNEFL